MSIGPVANFQDLNHLPLPVVAISGYSGSGKTYLIQALVKYFCTEFTVGYLKGDVHGFSMDYPGKDTFVVRQVGAQCVAIRNQQIWAALGDGSLNGRQLADIYNGCDFLLFEGGKTSSMAKILVIDQEEKILESYFKGEMSNVRAAVGSQKSCRLPGGIPYFCRDDVSGIAEFILSEIIIGPRQVRPVYGLLLAGGESRRMGQDKALLQYGSQSQAERALELLECFCEQTFVSARPGQVDNGPLAKRPVIEDRFLGFGPIAGILSAMMKFSEVRWLVLACDLPFVDSETLEYLLESKKCLKVARAFRSRHDQLPEPLCALYEPEFRQKIWEFLGEGIYCPRKMLIRTDHMALDLSNPSALDNINTPEEYQRARQSVQGIAAGDMRDGVDKNERPIEANLRI